MMRSRSRALLVSVVLALVVGPPVLAQAATLSLADALAALPQAPGWQKADLDYQSAVDALNAARAAAGLQVSAGGSYSRSDTIAGTGGSSKASAGLSVSASATVLPWAPAEAGIANAELALESAGLARDTARTSLVLTAEQQYFAARLATTSNDLAQQALAAAEAKLVAANAQHAQGQLSAEGLAQTEATVASAKAAAAQAKANLELARLTLFATLGLPPSEATLSTAATPGPGPEGNLDQLLKTAVTQRNDVKAARISVERAQRALDVSRAQRWIPGASLDVGVSSSDTNGAQAGIGVNAALDFQKGVLSGSASYPVAPAASGTVSTQLRIGATLSIPLDAPSSNASIASSRTALASAQAALAATQRAAELDIRQRYAAWQGAQATLAADQASVAAAQQALATAKARRVAGLATDLEVTSAQLTLGQAQRTVESDENALSLALLQLRTALGEPIATPGGQS